MALSKGNELTRKGMSESKKTNSLTAQQILNGFKYLFVSILVLIFRFSEVRTGQLTPPQAL